jgi:hypothetical protein
MNVNRVRTSASLKLLLGVLMTVCFLVTPAHAQSRNTRFKGTFELTHQVQWGKATLRPGSYSLAVVPMGITSETITVRDTSTGKIVVAELGVDDFYSAANDDSQLIIAVRGNQRAVASLQLAGMGQVYHPAHPFGTSESEAEEARNTEAISVETAQK